VKSGNRVSSEWGIGDVISNASIGTSASGGADSRGLSSPIDAAPDEILTVLDALERTQ
jgi:hypothetical protein